jgi:hypothetical protein
LEFPDRVYTQEEVEKANTLIQKGYKHNLKIHGSPEFKDKMQKVLQLIKTAGHYDFLRTYIREIREIEGFSQLHEADVMIWANMSMLTDLVDAASYTVQKAQQMKDYLEGNLYYGTGEKAALEKRLEFIKTLRDKSKSAGIQKRCEELLKEWDDTKIQFL